eukprot:TRINITY_DN1167_c0_g1_i1.p1 TRINITY_DN1167_c0_g1~~TRINITY_DN1167_c0_g1_i1.p1  ORF type:complete len:285 (+),score=70.94 TRINITY_DN1167_c0_g1_i1:104-958(+)
MLRSLVGSEMCIRDRYQRRVRGKTVIAMPSRAVATASQLLQESPDEDLTVMTATNIRRLCKEHGLYLMPNLNDRLYLQDQGFRKIQNLEEYSRLRALWLDNNAIHTLENLDQLVELQCLYLRHNSLEDLQGIEALGTLETLDVSGNFITSLGDLTAQTKLTEVLASNNHLSSLDDVQTLTAATQLRTLDLSHNQISAPEEEDPWAFVQFLEDFRVLENLNMEGNPIICQVPAWRMSVVARLPHLRTLDGVAVTDADRNGASQWAKDMTSSFGLPVWEWKFTGSS